MADVISGRHSWCNVRRVFEHAATIFVGLIVIIVGLGLGVARLPPLPTRSWG